MRPLTEQEQIQLVTKLMKSSADVQEWTDNAEYVKKMFGGYPTFWFKEIVLSGVLAKTQSRWSGEGQ